MGAKPLFEAVGRLIPGVVEDASNIEIPISTPFKQWLPRGQRSPCHLNQACLHGVRYVHLVHTVAEVVFPWLIELERIKHTRVEIAKLFRRNLVLRAVLALCWRVL